MDSLFARCEDVFMKDEWRFKYAAKIRLLLRKLSTVVGLYRLTKVTSFSKLVPQISLFSYPNGSHLSTEQTYKRNKTSEYIGKLLHPGARDNTTKKGCIDQHGETANSLDQTSAATGRIGSNNPKTYFYRKIEVRRTP